MYICLYFMSQVWTMKFPELTNTFEVSFRVGCAIKVNDLIEFSLLFYIGISTKKTGIQLSSSKFLHKRLFKIPL